MGHPKRQSKPKSRSLTPLAENRATRVRDGKASVADVTEKLREHRRNKEEKRKEKGDSDERKCGGE